MELELQIWRVHMNNRVTSVCVMNEKPRPAADVCFECPAVVYLYACVTEHIPLIIINMHMLIIDLFSPSVSPCSMHHK